MITPNQLERLPDLYEKAAKQAALKKAEYESLASQTKVMLSGIKNQLKREDPTLSESALTRLAEASKGMEIHYNGLNKARQDHLLAQAEYNSVANRTEVYRSILSYQISYTADLDFFHFIPHTIQKIKSF